MPFLIPLAGLDVVLVAVMALILLLALEPIRQFLTNLLSGIPVIGGAVAHWVADGITAAWNAIYGWLRSVIGDFDAFVASLFAPLQGIATAVVSALEAVALKIRDILTSVIPAAIAWLAGAIVQVKNDLEATITRATFAVVAWAEAQLATVDSYIAGVLSWAQTTIWNVATGIIRWTQTQLWNVYTDLANLIQRVGDTLVVDLQNVETWAYNAITGTLATLTQDVQALVTWTAGQLAQLESWAQSAVVAAYNAVFTNLGAAVSGALAPLWGVLSTTGTAVVNDVATAFPDIAAELQAIPEAVPLTVEDALAGLAAITIPLTEYVERCGMPLCRNLSGFGRELNNLSGLVSGAPMLAFLTEAIQHPEQAALEARDVVVPVVEPVAAAFHDLLR